MKLGSSSAAAIMGVSPYQNAYDLYLEKTGEKEPKTINQFITDKGETYQDLARLDLENETGLIWKPEKFVCENNDKIISGVDGFCEHDKFGNPIFWECSYVGKTKFNNFINDLLPLRERVSEQHYPKLIHHCYVTGGRDFYFSVVVDEKVFPSIGRGNLLFKHVKFSLTQDDEKYMNEEYVPKLLEFLAGLESSTPPMGIAATNDFIDISDSQLEALLVECEQEETKIKPLKNRVNELKKEIFEMSMPYNEKIIVNGTKVSVSASMPKEFIDYELLVKDNPHILKGIDIENYKRFSTPRTTKKITYSKS